ncbi:uncharacterized protein LOC124340534 [Daphnia pulicaria]|uniref:uncharacterized protein LOC124340534 n=1 Tax=Daphnia pulicaria TaxID=35523 RepID=UPI001EE9EC30|nr:uncharacterized protein LOC124340534 [Daphnia pulicaria]
MSQVLSEAETVANSFSSEHSNSSLASVAVDTKAPTVTEMTFGLYRVHWDLTSPPVARIVTFEKAFAIKHLPLQQTSTYVMTFRRSYSALGYLHSCQMICCPPAGHDAATPICLPRCVNLDYGDGKQLDVPPTNETCTEWGMTFSAANTTSSLDVYLKFHVFPFVELYRFMMNQEFCDVTFKFACGGIYKAHTAVLCVDNAYFQGMFRSGLMETKTGIVTISDTPRDLFVDMVHYWYTGILPQHYCSAAAFESVRSMCELANRYQHVQLKRDCERLIIGRLSVLNAMSLYVWAKTYNLPSLRQAAMAFMCSHWVEMTDMPDMVQFARENTERFLKLNAEIIRHMSGGE